MNTLVARIVPSPEVMHTCRMVGEPPTGGAALGAQGSAFVQIGEVAGRLGLSLRTLRYWDEVGLAVPSARSEGGFRLYSEADIERLAVIKDMKPLGLTLEEMGELVELLDRSVEPAVLSVDDLATVVYCLRGYADRTDEAIEKLGRRLAEAHELKQTLRQRIAACEALRARLG